MRKKIALLVAATVAGVIVSRQLAARRAEQELWTEATDPVEGR